MKQDKEIPVYIFVGFLESGKTTFVQATMEDPRFNVGERTLLLVCEEGECEYDIDKFPAKNVFVETIEDKDDLTWDRLDEVTRQHDIERVVVEYNGMWLLNDLFDAMPDAWMPYQIMMSADASTFLSYNANMRSLVVDKISSTQMIAFNRADGVDVDELHRIVRGLNRGCSIYYEYADGKTLYDDKEDPLPFDKDAAVIDIEDRDYALFYQDLMENMKDYNGKTVRFKGFCVVERMPKGTFAVGRHVMSCCVEDIQYYSLLVYSDRTDLVSQGRWVVITARVDVKFSRIYGRKGPVLKMLDLKSAVPPDDPVATFY